VALYGVYLMVVLEGHLALMNKRVAREAKPDGGGVVSSSNGAGTEDEGMQGRKDGKSWLPLQVPRKSPAKELYCSERAPQKS